MKVFITGGLGQIGSHTAEMLLERENKVKIIDNLATGRKEHLSKQENLEVIYGSISDRTLVFNEIENFMPDIVVHAACSYKDPSDWYNDTLTNCVGGVNIVDASREFGVKRIIYFQTALCYGLRPSEQPISLTHPRNPQGSSYAISKTANEL